MVRKLNKLLSVLLVVAMMFTYVAPWKALAVDESPESEPGMSDTGEPGGTNVPEGDGTDATNGPEDDGTDGQTVSHENYFGEDGLYHVWTSALTCTDETHHAHDASCNRSTEPVCGVKESAPVLTCTIEENHTHSVENGCYVEISEYEYYYYRYTEGSGSVTTSGSGRNTKYYYLSCTTPEGHTHGDECYTPGHTHTDECYISETPVCGKAEIAHTDACYTWTETTYNYYTVTFVPNNGTEEAPAEDITVNVVPELPEQFPVPAFPELTYEGHTLAGWYADSAFENSADLASLTGAATFYAKWTENPTEPDPPAEGNARGEITMEVGEIRTQNGSKGSGHAWTSSDLSIVKITDDDDEREVKFKGVSAGTAYLTHTYTNKGNQVTEYWKVTVSPAAPKTYTVRFSANGGSGSAPESVTVKEGETITLPGQGNLSGYGKVFVGWSNGSDATGSDNFTSQFVYPSGSYYTVTENVTLYATWASQGVTGTFFIRLDGRIPYEPGGYDSSDYSSGITIKNVISVAKFTSGESAVLANLRATPTADQIKKVWPTYDYRTQYIQWYVIKHEGDGWHIDGVLLERDLINLNYDANCVDPTGNVPMGDQYNVNDTVTVERGTVARRGYTFGSWNTASDGSGTSYEPGDTFTITEATTLYAQWIPNGNTKYIVEHYLETAAGSGEYTSAAREQKSGSTDSEVSATPNTYEGYEYNAAKSRATGIIAADGSLVLELYYDKLPTYGVTYEYATPGLPGAVADTIPSDDGMYLAGASVTAKSPSQTSVTVEENGVVIGTWSFNGWDEASKNMAEGGITFTGTWTYTETGKARVTHVYSGELPAAVMDTLPTDSNEYYIGAPVTPTAPTSTTVTIMNADGIVTDTYTFGGWDKQSDTMVSGGVTFTGTWTHTKTAQAGVQYVYSTPGLPGEVTATRPTDANLYYIGTAVNAQNPSSTSVDIVKNGVTVGTWTFGGWDKSSDTMVSGGITFTGTWTYEAATEYGVSYQYVAAEGTLPDAISTSGGAYAVSDSTTYLVNATVTRKNDVPAGTAYDVMENGVKTGTWTLTAWSADSAKMTDQGVTFTGTWTYKAAKQYTLTYVVDGNTVQTETLYAGQTVPSYEYTPDEAYLEFRGWYSNSGCTDSTTVPGTMPSDNLTVYGKTIYKTYEYTINYYYQNENGTSYTQDTSATRTDSAPYNTKISTVDPIGGMKTGFVFGHTSPASGSITIGTGSNVLNVYYDRGQYAYTIEYYYDNELDENATVTDTAAFGAEISYTEKAKPGFRFDNASASSITIGTGTNIIRVYYVKDSIGYTVNYYYDGVLDSSKTERLSAKFESVIETYPDKVIDGYKLDRATVPLTISATASQNVIDVYYVKDEFAYTIEYYKDGDTAPFATSNDLKAAFGSVITKASIADSIDANRPDGYTYSSDTAPLTITSTPFSNVIKVYYTKADYGYTIRYFKDGETDPFATSSGLTAAFGSVITKASITGNISANRPDGYKHSSDTAPLTIKSDAAENVIDVYYVKDSFSYTVEYYYDGVMDGDKTVTGTANFKDVIDSYTDKVVDGYKLDETNPVNIPLEISHDESKNVIKVYYVKDSFDYSVEYYYDGVIDSSKTVTGTANFKDVIEAYTDKVIDGYKLDETNPVNVPLEISHDESKNVIKVYYVKDSFKYSVEYYFDGIIDSSMTVTGTANFKDIIDSYTDKVIDGYKLEKTENLPLTISSNKDANVIRVYYVKNEFGYSVHYFYDGTEDTSKLETGVKTFGETIGYTDKVIDGYRLDYTDPASGEITISSKADENVINVYYVKRTDLSYTVKYYYNGVEDESLQQTVGNQTFDATVYPDAVPTGGDYLKDGYEFDSMSISDNSPLTISTGDNVIHVYYVKGDYPYSIVLHHEGLTDITIPGANEEFESQITRADIEGTVESHIVSGYKYAENAYENVPLTITADPDQNVIHVYLVKDSFGYTVNHIYEGDDSLNYSDSGSALFGSEIGYTANEKDGYKFDRDDATGGKISISSDPSKNVINVYYVKDSFGYTVEYYYDGIIDNSKTVTGTANFKDVIEAYTDKVIDGYKLDETNPVNVPLEISHDESKNVIKVYYVKDSFDYSVEYYYDGVIDSSKTVTGTANFKDIIDSYTDKVIDGYKLDETNPVNVPLEISHDESKNVIKVYYVKDSFDYSVEYYYDGVIDNSKTVTGTANFKDVIEAYTDKVIDGYKLDETNPVNVPLEISHDESKNVIKVYYVKDSFGYTVNHIYEGDDSLNYSDSGSALFGSEIGYTAIEKDGYKFDRDDATDGKISISSDSSKNVINVYYVKDSFGYTVNHIYEGDDSLNYSDSGSALFGSEIGYTSNEKDGYKFDRDDATGGKISISSDPSKNVINVYYVKDSFGYTVEYYYDGVRDDSATVSGSKTKFGTQITSYTDKVIRGYELETVTGLPLTISSNEASNVIRVYYVRSEYNYTVEYYYDGIRDDGATVTSSAKYQDVISTYPDKTTDGYVLSRDTAPLTIGTDESMNVIRVYYVRGEFGYRVEYYYDYELDESATEYGTATFGDVVDTFAHKYGVNYHFAGTSNFPLTVGSDADSNVIRVYYVSPEQEPEPEPEPEPENPIPNPEPELEPEPETEDPTEPETEEPTEDIPDEDVPLGGNDGLIDIPDEDVPLANIPKTGDENELIILAGALGISSVALAILLLKGRRKKDSDSESK